ncbi:hypothetical protein PCASD_23391 [Puccinia coronata f. sp. avenae]|uniref:Uncharacterized protein n=1 Tax=Puccinia coronata f. sp. avenae TaxID=200324 RepID=A0A2N5SKC2_9BASI|nr:hypothetical protein PCASD_23391 [Puccinia coronata f. sp. avenae]
MHDSRPRKTAVASPQVLAARVIRLTLSWPPADMTTQSDFWQAWSDIRVNLNYHPLSQIDCLAISPDKLNLAIAVNAHFRLYNVAIATDFNHPAPNQGLNATPANNQASPLFSWNIDA